MLFQLNNHYKLFEALIDICDDNNLTILFTKTLIDPAEFKIRNCKKAFAKMEDEMELKD